MEIEMSSSTLDCVIIGYYEPPFEEYEAMVRGLGEDSEAYRDLKFSFVEIGGRKMTYAELLSHAYRLASGDQGTEDVFKSGDIPSLAAVYLTNFLRRRGLRAQYINLFLFEQDKLRDYLARKPCCVAITTTFYGLNFPVNEMIRAIRKHDEAVKIVVGGPLIANHHRRYPEAELLIALDDMAADFYVIESQGEQTLYRIVRCLRDGGDPARIPNLVYRSADGSLARTAAERESNSLAENFIDWRLFAGETLGATLQTRTARSCAFSCAFCAYPTRAGKLTLAGIDTIERELDSMVEVGGVRNAVFIDDTFNVPLPRFKDICRLLIRKRYGLRWFSYFRCSNSDEEAIDLMAESGCAGVFLGVESGSAAILENMDKHAAVPQYLQGIKLLRERGILTFGSFITGYPGETEATVRETIDFIKESKLDYYRLQIWYCEPGTPIFERKEKYGIVGEGFGWVHDTMESLEAMDHIDRAFLEIKESRWLPQWSFDFWIIPYLLGKGLSSERFGAFMTHANRALVLEIASVPEVEKRRQRDESLQGMVEALRGFVPAS
jgi:radical SAM PhpK family P-methyltransferase